MVDFPQRAADDRNEFARPYTQIHPVQRHDPLEAVTEDLAHPGQPQSTTLRGAGVGRGRHTVVRAGHAWTWLLPRAVGAWLRMRTSHNWANPSDGWSGSSPTAAAFRVAIRGSAVNWRLAHAAWRSGLAWRCPGSNHSCRPR